jgi:hypothetical protein
MAGAPAFCYVVLAQDGSITTEYKDINGKYANVINVRFDDEMENEPTANIFALDHYAHARHARQKAYNQAITKGRIQRIARNFAHHGESNRRRPLIGREDHAQPKYEAMTSVDGFLTQRAALLTQQAERLALTAPAKHWI